MALNLKRTWEMMTSVKLYTFLVWASALLLGIAIGRLS